MSDEVWHDFNLAWWRRMCERAGLNGTNRSAVRLLTGLTDEELTDLGGFTDDDAT